MLLAAELRAGAQLESLVRNSIRPAACFQPKGMKEEERDVARNRRCPQHSTSQRGQPSPLPASIPACFSSSSALCLALTTHSTHACRTAAPMPLATQSKAVWPPLLLVLLLALQLGAVQSSRATLAAPADSSPAASAVAETATRPLGGVTPLAPFSRILSCLPFSLLIQPTTGSSAAAQDGSPAYRLQLDTDDASIAAALDYNVSADGTLLLSLAPNITTNSCASVTVGLPPDALREVRLLAAAPLLLRCRLVRQVLLLPIKSSLGSPHQSVDRPPAWTAGPRIGACWLQHRVSGRLPGHRRERCRPCGCDRR